MSLSPLEILIILVILALIFGVGKLPKVMDDLGRAVRSFKDGVADREATPPSPPAPVSPPATDNPVATTPAGPLTRGEEAPRS